MSSTRNQLIISLFPDALSAAVVRRGKVAQAEKLELDPALWNSTWSDGLMRLDQPLRQLISRFSSRAPSEATVIYQSPTCTQQVDTFDLGAQAACVAGAAKIQESVGFNASVETSVLSETTRGSDSTTVLAYSEREEQLRSLYAWLNRCNITVASLVPSSVAVMATAARIALNAEESTAVFFIGSEVSVLAYATSSGLKLIRTAEIGYRKLAEGYLQALTTSAIPRPASSHSNQEKTTNASFASDATKMLFEHGIPMDSIEIDGQDLRSAVLPILAPVLQRFCIEVKQTFRFGLGGEEMPKNLMLCGPGATIPMMSKAISQHIDMHLKIDPTVDGFSPTDPFGRGSFEATVISLGSCPEGMLPEIAHDASTRSTLTRALVTGAALAAIAMGTEYTLTALKAQEVSQRVQTDAPRLSAVNRFHDQLDTAGIMSGTISDISELVTGTVESIPRWYDLLANLSPATPESVHVLEIRGETGKTTSAVDISGIAVSDSERNAGASLNEFLGAVKAIPGVTEVNLGATSRVSVGDSQWGRQFTMKIQLKQTALPHAAFVQKPVNQNEWDKP